MNEFLLPLGVGIALGLPLVLAALLAFSRQSSRLSWLLLVLLCASVALYLSLASPIWAWVGFEWQFLSPVVVVAAALWSARRLRAYPALPRARFFPLAVVVLHGALAVLFGFMLVDSHISRATPPDTVDLSFPFGEGHYVVMHGGGSRWLNNHRVVPAQAWAVDIVALNDRGRRARGMLPSALDAYAIFDRAVVAPCDGTVSGMSDGAPDTPVGGSNPVRPAGNHVLLSCMTGDAAITLLLAHFRPGSVVVAEGDRVRRGALLGHVGNSGNSTEPHLHIHAVRGHEVPLGAAIAIAEAAPLTFDGRFLTRNDIIRVPDAP